jgi:hypothetical protein
VCVWTPDAVRALLDAEEYRLVYAATDWTGPPALVTGTARVSHPAATGAEFAQDETALRQTLARTRQAYRHASSACVGLMKGADLLECADDPRHGHCNAASR